MAALWLQMENYFNARTGARTCCGRVRLWNYETALYFNVRQSSTCHECFCWLSGDSANLCHSPRPAGERRWAAAGGVMAKRTCAEKDCIDGHISGPARTTEIVYLSEFAEFQEGINANAYENIEKMQGTQKLKFPLLYHTKDWNSFTHFYFSNK